MSMMRLPEEIQLDITLRLPSKSIKVCRCVCKPLCRLLYNPKFIKDHLLNQKNKNPSLMLISHPICRSIDFASILSASSEPASTVTCDVSIPMINNFVQRHWERHHRIQVVGSCNGFICIRSSNSEFCIWNPTTGEDKILSCFRSMYGEATETVRYGFGYDSDLDDYKLVKIVTNVTYGIKFIFSFAQVEIRTLGSNSYKTILCPKIYNILPPLDNHVWFLNGALHWSGFISATNSRVIVSFNINSERFVDFFYPEEIINVPRINNPYDRIGLLDDRLCLILYGGRFSPMDVWVMQDYGVRESWTKQFSFKRPFLGNRNPLKLAWSSANGMALIDFGEKKILYDPESDSTKDFEIPGFDHMAWSLPVSYLESLVSLNKSGPTFGWVEEGNSNEVITKKQRRK